MSATTKSLSQRPTQELTPQQLATQWKKTGQFDKLRKQLLQDFLASPDKDVLLKELDSILPSLISDASPPLSRIPRKDRPTHLMTALDKSNTLTPNTDKVKARLNRKGEKGSKGIGRTIERELRGCIRNSRGIKGEEEMADSQEEEEKEEEEVKKEDEDVKMEEKEEESVQKDVPASDPVPQPNVSTSADPSPLPIPTSIESAPPSTSVAPSQPPPPAPTNPAPTMPTSIPDPALQVPDSTEKRESKDVEMTPAPLAEALKLEDIINIEED